MRLDEGEARRRFGAGRVARMSTVDSDGRPHLVPVTFAVRDDVVAIAVDEKPKSSRDLKRLRNIESNPQVSMLVDEYSEDWSALWWVRADGTATVSYAIEEFAGPLGWLTEKYPQYRESVPAGPVIRVDVRRWSGWSAR